MEGEVLEREAGRKVRVRREERKAYWRRVCARGGMLVWGLISEGSGRLESLGRCGFGGRQVRGIKKHLRGESPPAAADG